MKSMFILSLVFLLGCSQSKETSAPEREGEEAALYTAVSFDKQSLLFQGVRADIVLMMAERDDGQDVLLYQVTTSTQTLQFGFQRSTEELLTSLPKGAIELLEKVDKIYPEPIDLKLMDFQTNLAVHNTLSLDRCRGLKLRSQAISFLQMKKEMVYLAIQGLSLRSDIALKWNVKTKSFAGFAKTSRVTPFVSGEFEGQELFLTPNSNPRDSLGELFSDSLFMSLDAFNRSCDAWYDMGDEKRSSRSQDPSERYLPRFDKTMDEWRSNLINDFVSLRSVFGSSEPIYRVPKRMDLRADLLESAITNPLYPSFLNGETR